MYKVAYATGSRAEYGIVKRYLHSLNNEEDIQVEILVTGAHLDKKYGYTVDEIKADGFNIAKEVPLSINVESNSNITKSMAKCLYEFGSFFENNKYDLLIILGDRYEMLSVAIAAAMNNQPILHIHGGEKTLGNYDEFIRHSITKMSLYHFTATEEYRNRVIQLGECPDRVFYVGALGAENALINVEENYKLDFPKPYLLVLYHPETLTSAEPAEQIEEVISAVDYFKNDYHIVFIGSNADTKSDQITDRVYEYCKSNNCTYLVNVENKEYQNIVAKASVYIGNSSSGIIESPTIGTNSVNIGDRQKGRVKATSTIDVKCDRIEIIKGIQKALNLNIKIENPYYKEDTLNNYVCLTKKLLREKISEQKDFYDLN
ncbi:UDP-N-acetylglucosamine 2-epimerase [Carnobacterium jeotgali]|uniref:UDP-N-acetylglucosamine 2-epimerase n=1 Tax=Carnobacterium jeotgali TaxID=545534 RepID=UPI00049301BC|nr:UDP-N-acetylglucosamine 2-epimerase [Carnobacterium jeotgali]